jgi:hypothetical protein
MTCFIKHTLQAELMLWNYVTWILRKTGTVTKLSTSALTMILVICWGVTTHTAATWNVLRNKQHTVTNIHCSSFMNILWTLYFTTGEAKYPQLTYLVKANMVSTVQLMFTIRYTSFNPKMGEKLCFQNFQNPAIFHQPVTNLMIWWRGHTNT